MHSLVHTQAFDVRPLQHVALLTGVSLRVVQRSKLDELCLGVRLYLVEHRIERETDPWNYHRPSLDTAHAVNALFQVQFEQAVDVERLRLVDQALDLDRPGTGIEV